MNELERVWKRLLAEWKDEFVWRGVILEGERGVAVKDERWERGVF